LQHEKSEVEKRLRDVQQHLYDLTTASNSIQERSIHDEGNQAHEDQTRFQPPLNDQQQNDSNNPNETNHVDDELQASTSSQPIITEHKETDESLIETNVSENNESEQQIIHD
ncbi:unnamed protein product, partial [Rotaria sp. Silwood1]